MAYRRKTVVPNARLSDGGLRMFEGLRPEEKEIVFQHFMEHWDAARVKDAEEVPELPKLERRLSNCLDALCQSADEGISEYWRITERNNRNAQRGSPPMDNQSLTSGQPINQPINQLSNESKNHPSTYPTLSEIEAYCRENSLGVDAQAFWLIMENQGWRTKDGREVEDWRLLLRSWGRGTAGKTVSAQRYTQRDYTEDDLLAVSGDLLEEARQRREEPVSKYHFLFENTGGVE